MSRPIFLTGNRGFIGTRLQASILGYTVGYDIAHGKDIRDLYSLKKEMMDSGTDTVIHLAARAGACLGESHIEEYVSTNVVGTWNVVKAAEAAGVKNLIFFSSSSVLGGCDLARGLTVSDPYSPKSTYGWTKATGEMIVKAAKEIPHRIIVRPFSVYGPQGRNDMVLGKWIRSVKEGSEIIIHGKEMESSRGYTYVEDLTRAISLLVGEDSGKRLMESVSEPKIFHLGGTQNISLKTLFDMFCRNIPESLGWDMSKVKHVDRPGWDITHSFAEYEPTGIIDPITNRDIWTPGSDFEDNLRKIMKISFENLPLGNVI